MDNAASNRYLEGLYAPLVSEVTAFDLHVEGVLPDDLEGRYLRNGPNPTGALDSATHHWYSGEGMVHGVRIRGGRAEWYRARRVRGASSVNTAVMGLGDRTFALVEAGARPVELSYELETIGESDLGAPAPMGYSAHPKVDPETGEIHAIAYHWSQPHVEYVVTSPDGGTRQVVQLDVPGGPMMHDCSITQRFMVIFDLPVTFDIDSAMKGGRYQFPYTWNDAHPSRIGLVPLGGSGDQLRWFDVDPCMVFHTLNAYDDDDRVVIDVVRYPRMFASHRMGGPGPDDGAPALWRWTVDTRNGTVTERQLSDQPLEFPQIDPRLLGRRCRWAYASEVVRTGDTSGFDGRLVRIDVDTGDSRVIGHGEGRTAGEWSVVPRPDGRAEDDAWLISFGHDAATGRGELVVLDAEAPDAGPVARVPLPSRVPVGFHGQWIPDVVAPEASVAEAPHPAEIKSPRSDR